MRVKVIIKKCIDFLVMAACFALVILMIRYSVIESERKKAISAASDMSIMQDTDGAGYNSTISFPVCNDITVDLSKKTNDFSYSNPETNDCYIRVSITRLDNNEIIYQSSSISPGNSISGITFSPEFKYQGTYDVRIKIDAHAKDRMKYLNGIVVNKKIIVN